VYVAKGISTFGFGSFGEDCVNVLFGTGSAAISPVKYKSKQIGEIKPNQLIVSERLGGLLGHAKNEVSLISKMCGFLINELNQAKVPVGVQRRMDHNKNSTSDLNRFLFLNAIRPIIRLCSIQE